MKPLRCLAAAAVVALCAAAAVAAPLSVLPSHTLSPTPAIGAGTRPAFRRASLPVRLPDSVVARIFVSRDAGIDVTRRDFRQAVVQLQLPPGAPTPQQRAQVLELLLQKKLLAAQAAREPRAWAHDDSVNFRGLTDHLTLRAALDSALAEMGFALAARGDTIPDKGTLGVMVRDSTMARLHPVYDEALLRRVADAFVALPHPGPGAGMQEQIRARTALPALAASDSARKLVASPAGDYTAGQLLADFERLNAAYRPAIRSADDVRDAVNNVIYENILREHVVAQDLARRPAIASQLAQRAEFLDVQSYVRRAAYDRVPTDSATVRRHYDRHPRWFDTWARADVVRGLFATRAQADSFARVLAVPGESESLVTRRMDGGLAYATYLTEDADTALFARVRRAGTARLVGPDETVDGWRVLRAMRIEPRHARPFEEAYDIVLNDWYQRDGDRRVNELLRRLTETSLVQVNDAALSRLSGAAPARPAAPAPARRPGGAR